MLLVFLYSLLFKLQAPEPVLMEKPEEVETSKLSLEKHKELESCQLFLEKPADLKSSELCIENPEVRWSPFQKVTYM